MIIARAQRVWRVTFDALSTALAQQRGEAAYQQSGPTTSDLAERFTGPSRECMEWLGEMGPSTYDVYSWFAGCTSRALESEHFR